MASNVIADFFAGTAVFFVLKLTTSVDDVIWLSPFLAIADGNIHRKLQCGLIYAFICLIVTFEALLIDVVASLGSEELIKALENGDEMGGDGDDGEQYWSASRFLCVFASICIAAFACKELKEWYEEEEEDEDDGTSSIKLSNMEGEAENQQRQYDKLQLEEEPEQEEPEQVDQTGDGEQSIEKEQTTIPTVQISDSTQSSKSSVSGPYNSFAELEEADGEAVPFIDEEKGITVVLSQRQQHNQSESQDKKQTNEKHTLSSLFVVAFFGTLDDLALFSAVLMGKSIEYPSLLCGSMLAAVVIILASWCVSLFKPFQDFMQRIPLWSLLFAIAVYILIDGLLW